MAVGSCNCRIVHTDFDRCYRAIQSKDARFDGWFVTAVLTTGIYCRPSCPVRPPFARNVCFYPARGRRPARRIPRL
jgi:AraC family transcriptional regulator of adaptative response / DNA-3-methyladenine glycosylase II